MPSENCNFKKIIEKVKDLIAAKARLIIRHTPQCVGILIAATHTLLRISTRWIPYLITEVQTLAQTIDKTVP